MKQIYGYADGEIQVAWVGESAPIPEGWSLDANEVLPKEPPKKRGRPRKNSEPEEE